jgi:O-antigen ligase
LLAALTCALTPAYTIRWHVGFYPSTVLEVAVVLTVVAFVVETWRTGALPDLRTPLTLPAALFLLAGAISVVAAPDRRAALGIFRAYLIEPIAFFLVLAVAIRTTRQALFVFAGLAAAGVVVGIANSVVILDALRHHQVSAELTGPVVIYTNANDIALFLVPLIAVAGAVVLFGEDRRVRWAALVFVIIAIVSTLLSFSRGGYLALAAVSLGIALAHSRRWWLLGGAAGAAIVLLLIPPINRRVSVELDFANPANTLVGRFGLWQATLKMLEQHPIFGAGLSGFAQVIAPYWNPFHTDRFIYPHNIVLTFWSETGLLGLAAFAWILVTGFVISRRAWRDSSSEWRPIGLGVLLALVAVVVHGLVDVPYFKNDLSLEFWALLGLTAASAAAATRRPGGLLFMNSSQPGRSGSG